MQYTDRVYGTVEITEPIILELIEFPTLERLKHIDQAGYFEPYFPGTAHSRFEHSIGVMILLKKFGAPLEEQIAGLIHDVSHSAFSHCIDYVLGSASEAKQDHQDNISKTFVKNSEIPSIVHRHGLDMEYVLDDTHFPLKEKELPDLCADRLDYSLRDAYVHKEIPDARYFLDHLTAANGKWIFKNFESAKKYAELFQRMNTVYWTGMPTAIMFRTVGDYLKYGLQKGYITETDLYTTDTQVLDKMRLFQDSDSKLQILWKRMNNEVKVFNNAKQYDAHLFCKSRVVDPLCEHKGNILRISEIDSTWGTVVTEESKPKEYFLTFEE